MLRCSHARRMSTLSQTVVAVVLRTTGLEYQAVISCWTSRILPFHRESGHQLQAYLMHVHVVKACWVYAFHKMALLLESLTHPVCVKDNAHEIISASRICGRRWASTCWSCPSSLREMSVLVQRPASSMASGVMTWPPRGKPPHNAFAVCSHLDDCQRKVGILMLVIIRPYLKRLVVGWWLVNQAGRSAWRFSYSYLMGT